VCTSLKVISIFVVFLYALHHHVHVRMVALSAMVLPEQGGLTLVPNNGRTALHLACEWSHLLAPWLL
jgi:hypothetical protein